MSIEHSNHLKKTMEPTNCYVQKFKPQDKRLDQAYDNSKMQTLSTIKINENVCKELKTKSSEFNECASETDEMTDNESSVVDTYKPTHSREKLVLKYLNKKCKHCIKRELKSKNGSTSLHKKSDTGVVSIVQVPDLKCLEKYLTFNFEKGEEYREQEDNMLPIDLTTHKRDNKIIRFPNIPDIQSDCNRGIECVIQKNIQTEALDLTKYEYDDFEIIRRNKNTSYEVLDIFIPLEHKSTSIENNFKFKYHAGNQWSYLRNDHSAYFETIPIDNKSFTSDNTNAISITRNDSMRNIFAHAEQKPSSTARMISKSVVELQRMANISVQVMDPYGQTESEPFVVKDLNYELHNKVYTPTEYTNVFVVASYVNEEEQNTMQTKKRNQCCYVESNHRVSSSSMSDETDDFTNTRDVDKDKKDLPTHSKQQERTLNLNQSLVDKPVVETPRISQNNNSAPSPDNETSSEYYKSNSSSNERDNNNNWECLAPCSKISLCIPPSADKLFNEPEIDANTIPLNVNPESDEFKNKTDGNQENKDVPSSLKARGFQISSTPPLVNGKVQNTQNKPYKDSSAPSTYNKRSSRCGKPMCDNKKGKYFSSRSKTIICKPTPPAAEKLFDKTTTKAEKVSINVNTELPVPDRSSFNNKKPDNFKNIRDDKEKNVDLPGCSKEYDKSISLTDGRCKDNKRQSSVSSSIESKSVRSSPEQCFNEPALEDKKLPINARSGKTIIDTTSFIINKSDDFTSTRDGNQEKKDLSCCSKEHDCKISSTPPFVNDKLQETQRMPYKESSALSTHQGTSSRYDKSISLTDGKCDYEKRNSSPSCSNIKLTRSSPEQLFNEPVKEDEETLLNVSSERSLPDGSSSNTIQSSGFIDTRYHNKGNMNLTCCSRKHDHTLCSTQPLRDESVEETDNDTSVPSTDNRYDESNSFRNGRDDKNKMNCLSTCSKVQEPKFSSPEQLFNESVVTMEELPHNSGLGTSSVNNGSSTPYEQPNVGTNVGDDKKNDLTSRSKELDYKLTTTKQLHAEPEADTRGKSDCVARNAEVTVLRRSISFVDETQDMEKTINDDKIPKPFSTFFKKQNDSIKCIKKEIRDCQHKLDTISDAIDDNVIEPFLVLLCTISASNEKVENSLSTQKDLSISEYPNPSKIVEFIDASTSAIDPEESIDNSFYSEKLTGDKDIRDKVSTVNSRKATGYYSGSNISDDSPDIQSLDANKDTGHKDISDSVSIVNSTKATGYYSGSNISVDSPDIQSLDANKDTGGKNIIYSLRTVNSRKATGYYGCSNISVDSPDIQSLRAIEREAAQSINTRIIKELARAQHGTIEISASKSSSSTSIILVGENEEFIVPLASPKDSKKPKLTIVKNRNKMNTSIISDDESDDYILVPLISSKQSELRIDQSQNQMDTINSNPSSSENRTECNIAQCRQTNNNPLYVVRDTKEKETFKKRTAKENKLKISLLRVYLNENYNHTFDDMVEDVIRDLSESIDKLLQEYLVDHVKTIAFKKDTDIFEHEIDPGMKQQIKTSNASLNKDYKHSSSETKTEEANKPRDTEDRYTFKKYIHPNDLLEDTDTYILTEEDFKLIDNEMKHGEILEKSDASDSVLLSVQSSNSITWNDKLLLEEKREFESSEQEDKPMIKGNHCRTCYYCANSFRLDPQVSKKEKCGYNFCKTNDNRVEECKSCPNLTYPITNETYRVEDPSTVTPTIIASVSKPNTHLNSNDRKQKLVVIDIQDQSVKTRDHETKHEVATQMSLNEVTVPLAVLLKQIDSEIKNQNKEKKRKSKKSGKSACFPCLKKKKHPKEKK